MKLNIIRAIAIATLLLGFAVPRSVGAQARGPSTAEERARAVKVAHDLEDNPLGEEANIKREWLMQWITDIPDITVNACSGFFGMLPDPPRGHSVEISKQMIISSAAFMIEHPEKAKNYQAVDFSGLMGALKAYKSVLKQEPDSRWEYLDMLLQFNEEGSLGSYVGEIREKCNSDGKNKDPYSRQTQVRKRANLSS